MVELKTEAAFKRFHGSRMSVESTGLPYRLDINEPYCCADCGVDKQAIVDCVRCHENVPPGAERVRQGNGIYEWSDSNYGYELVDVARSR